MAQEVETKRPRRLVRQKQLKPEYGIDWGPTQIWQLVRDKQFPAPVRHKDGGRAIGWLSDEIEQWLEDRRAQRDARVAAEATAAK